VSSSDIPPIPGYVTRRLAQDIRGDGERGIGDQILGTLGASGKGIVDSALGLGRGLYWLGTMGGDTSHLPQNIYDLLPHEQAAQLSSRIAGAGFAGEAGEVTGHLLSILGGGGLSAAGKGVGKKGLTATEAGLQKVLGKTVGSKIGQVGEKVAGLGSAPGAAIKGLEWPGKLIGNRLAKMPGVREWSKVAKAVPDIAGAGTGFMFYNLLTTDQDYNLDGVTNLEDRKAAALHGLFAGASLSVLGKFADKMEGMLLSGQAKGSEAARIARGITKARSGKMGLNEISNIIGPRAVSTAIEAAGWAGLDPVFRDALLSGDFDAAIEQYAKSVPGALLARTGRVDAWQQWRRQMPDLNNMGMRRDMVAAGRASVGVNIGESTPLSPQQPKRVQQNIDLGGKASLGSNAKQFTIINETPVRYDADFAAQQMRGKQPLLPETAAGIGEPADAEVIKSAQTIADATNKALAKAQDALAKLEGRNTSKYTETGLKRHNTLLAQARKAVQDVTGQARQAADNLSQLQRQGTADPEVIRMGQGAASQQVSQEDLAKQPRTKRQLRQLREGVERPGPELQQPGTSDPRQQPMLPSVHVGAMPLSTPFKEAMARYLQRRFAGRGEKVPTVEVTDLGPVSREPQEPQKLLPADVMEGRDVIQAGERAPAEVDPQQEQQERLQRPRTLQQVRQLQQGVEKPGPKLEQPRSRRHSASKVVRRLDHNDQVSLFGDPLVSAGFELAADYDARIPVIDLEYPGTPGRLRMVSRDLMGVTRLEVSSAWFNAVRGTEVTTPYVAMTDSATIYDFVHDLAAVAQMRQMSNVLHLSGDEHSAGGLVKTGDGAVARVGVDGKIYQQMLPLRDAEPEARDVPAFSMDSFPENVPTYVREFLLDALDFAKGLRATHKPTRGVDRIEAAIVTAIKGQDTVAGQEVLQALETLADVVSSGIEAGTSAEIETLGDGLRMMAQTATPADIELMGEVLGEVGSGNLPANDIVDRLDALSTAQAPNDNPAAGRDPFAKPESDPAADDAELVRQRLRQEFGLEVASPSEARATRPNIKREPDQEARSAAIAISNFGRSAARGLQGKFDRPLDIRARETREDMLESILQANRLKRTSPVILSELANPASSRTGKSLLGAVMDAEQQYQAGDYSAYDRLMAEYPNIDQVLETKTKQGRNIGAGGLAALARDILQGKLKTEQQEVQAQQMLETYELLAEQEGGVEQPPRGARRGQPGEPYYVHTEFGSQLIDIMKRGMVPHLPLPELKKGKGESEQDYNDRGADAVMALHAAEFLNRFANFMKEQGPGLITQRVDELRGQLYSTKSVAKGGKIKRRIAAYLNAPELAHPISTAKQPLKRELQNFWKRDRQQYEANKAAGKAADSWSWKDGVNKFLNALRKAAYGKYADPDNPRAGERGSVIGGGPATWLLNPKAYSGILDIIAATGSRVRNLGDQLFVTRLEAIRRAIPDSPFSYMLAEINSRRRRHRGEMDALMKPALAATGNREWATEKVDLPVFGGQLVRADQVPAGTNNEWNDLVPGVESVRFARWELMAEGKLPARTGDDAPKSKQGESLDVIFRDAAQNTLGYAYKTAQNAGGWIGEGGAAHMLGDVETHIFPRVLGPDYADVLKNKPLRDKWFKVLELYNDNLTAQQLESLHNSRSPLTGEKVSLDEKTAMERTRFIDVMPHQFTVDGRTYDMLRSDVGDVLTNVNRLQSGHIAAMEVVGQDGSKATRDKVRKQALNILNAPQRLADAQTAAAKVTEKMAEAERQLASTEAELGKTEQMIRSMEADRGRLMEAAERQKFDADLSRAYKDRAKMQRGIIRLRNTLKRGPEDQQRADARIESAKADFSLSQQAEQVLRNLDKGGFDGFGETPGEMGEQLPGGAPGPEGQMGQIELALRELKANPDIDVVREAMLTRLITEGATLSQGRSIDQNFAGAGLLRFVRSLDSIPRSIMTMFAPVYDVAEYGVLPFLYGSPGQTMRLFKKVYGDTKDFTVMDAVRENTRLGAITSKLGVLLYEQNAGATGRISGFFGKAGEITEIGKAYFIAELANIQLSDFRQGIFTRADTRRMEMLGLEPDLQQRLMSGNFSETDANRYRTDLVRHATRRAEPGEGVPTSDMLAVQSLVRFSRFMAEHSSRIVQAFREIPKSKPEDRMANLGRAMALTTGFYATSTLGFSVLGVLLHGILRGDDDEDIKRRMMDGLFSYEGQLQNVQRALLGGVPATALDMLTSQRNEDALRSTAIGDYITTLREAYFNLGEGGFELGDAFEMLRSLHLIPLEADVMNRGYPRVKEHVIAAATGMKLSRLTKAIRYRDVVTDYMRNNVKRKFGLIPEQLDEFKRKRGREFYDKLDEGMKVWLREVEMDDGTGNQLPEKAWAGAMKIWQEAVEMDESSPESVAGWLRSQKAYSRLRRADHDIDDFIAYAGKDLTKEILAHDDALELLAKTVGRLEGKLSDSWTEDVEEFRRIAMASNRGFEKFVDNAVEAATRSIRQYSDEELAEPDYQWIQDIAPIIARHRHVWREVFKDSRVRDTFDAEESAQIRKETAAGMLIKRAVRRFRSRAKEEAIEREARENRDE
tara:strand:+ start:17983 stop:25686 length:7704 start_codon:yes stop_codon:yes gene_type:complete